MEIGISNKKCPTCKQLLPLEAFPFSKSGICSYCKKCYKKYKRKEHLKRAYNLSIEDYEKKLVLQKYKCAICQKHQQKLTKLLVIDHNHKTAQIRGLLCLPCNINLGVIKRQDFVTIGNKYLIYWNNH